MPDAGEVRGEVHDRPIRDRRGCEGPWVVPYTKETKDVSHTGSSATPSKARGPLLVGTRPQRGGVGTPYSPPNCRTPLGVTHWLAAAPVIEGTDGGVEPPTVLSGFLAAVIHG